MSLSQSGAIVWPDTLTPRGVVAEVAPFTRSGGRTFSGLERVTRTDRGWWSISYDGVILRTRAQRQCWDAIRTMLSGRAGLVAVPVHSYGTAPYPNAATDAPQWSRAPLSIPHGDGSTFSDGSGYRQRIIDVKTTAAAFIGATTISLTIVNADSDLTGTRFSYNLALYEIGPKRTDGSYLISPAIRAVIPAGACLEFDSPKCLCRLADDRAMAHGLTVEEADSHSLGFTEAVDVWSDLAAAGITISAPVARTGGTTPGPTTPPSYVTDELGEYILAS